MRKTVIMKYKVLWMLVLVLFFSCNKKRKTNESELTSITNISLSNSTEYQEIEKQNLYELIGKNFNSKEAHNFTSKVGKYEIKDYFEGKKDYIYENDGIQVRTNLKGIIEVIYLFNYKTESWKNKSFKGNLPFDLKFSDSFDDIKNKIGEGTLFHSYGFYGRIFRWQIQDSLKLGIELDLPRSEKEKIFIEQVTLSKTK